MIQTPTSTYLQWLVRDASTVELCHVDRGISPQWHSDPEILIEQARGLARTGNLFTTLNRLNHQAVMGYLADGRREDPAKVRRTMDDHVVRYTRILFDFDPGRPKNTSSTNEELEEAKIRALDCIAVFHALGWPRPAVAMSGNGWHLQYRTALANTAEFREMLRVVYDELHARFSDDVVSFDRTVKNPARLCALYGSVKRKGQNTSERPHRKSWISIPPAWEQVLPGQIELVANQWAKHAPARRPEPRRDVPASRMVGHGDFATLDVVAWFQAHDHYLEPARGHMHKVLCPWRSEHTMNPDGGTIVFESDGGWPGFHCKHSHCVDRDIRSVMALWGDVDRFCAADYRREVAA